MHALIMATLKDASPTLPLTFVRLPCHLIGKGYIMLPLSPHMVMSLLCHTLFVAMYLFQQCKISSEPMYVIMRERF